MTQQKEYRNSSRGESFIESSLGSTVFFFGILFGIPVVLGELAGWVFGEEVRKGVYLLTFFAGMAFFMHLGSGGNSPDPS